MDGHSYSSHQQPLQPPTYVTSSITQLPPPPAAKWIQDNEDSDHDQVGLVPHNRGYKHILFSNNKHSILTNTNNSYNI